MRAWPWGATRTFAAGCRANEEKQQQRKNVHAGDLPPHTLARHHIIGESLRPGTPRSEITVPRANYHGDLVLRCFATLVRIRVGLWCFDTPGELVLPLSLGLIIANPSLAYSHFQAHHAICFIGGLQARAYQGLCPVDMIKKNYRISAIKIKVFIILCWLFTMPGLILCSTAA